MFSHDDWGSKNSLFMSPETWREFIKPQYIKTYRYMKDHGVIVIHHADSFLEPIVEDMVDLGIDVWQGVLPQNDIPALQKQLDGRMTLMGGIDARIDRQDSTEEEIRKETRRACETYGPGGGFIPALTNLYGIYPMSIPLFLMKFQSTIIWYMAYKTSAPEVCHEQLKKSQLQRLDSLHHDI